MLLDHHHRDDDGSKSYRNGYVNECYNSYDCLRDEYSRRDAHGGGRRRIPADYAIRDGSNFYLQWNADGGGYYLLRDAALRSVASRGTRWKKHPLRRRSECLGTTV